MCLIKIGTLPGGEEGRGRTGLGLLQEFGESLSQAVYFLQTFSTLLLNPCASLSSLSYFRDL